MEADRVDRVRHIDCLAFAHRLATVDAFHNGELVAVFLQELGEFEEGRLPVAGRQQTPATVVERRFRICNRIIDINSVTGRDLG